MLEAILEVIRPGTIQCEVRFAPLCWPMAMSPVVRYCSFGEFHASV
jgi:hypothetical protein